jgi:predicted RNA binding protein YcfA (HicA-like mRNA interferase family)
MAKCSEILRLLLQNGWLIERQKGSHVILSHPEKVKKISFPNHGSTEMKKGIMIRILKDAGLR